MPLWKLLRTPKWRVAVICTGVGGCSLAPLVTTESVAYNNTVEDVSTTVLVTNILRAKESSPLFFSDISQLRGTYNLSLAAQATFPFGPINRPLTTGGVRDSASLGPLSFTNNPSFDEAPLTTKQFTQGLLNSVSETLVAYYVQRVSIPAPFLELFIKEIDATDSYGTTTRANNSLETESRKQYFKLLREWTSDHSPDRPLIHPLKIVAPISETKFGPVVRINADTLIKAKAASLSVRPISGDAVQFVEKSSVVTLCVPNSDDTDYIAVGLVSISSQNLPSSDHYQNTNANCHDRASSQRTVVQDIRYQAHIRSVEGIFYYLGYLQRSEVKNSCETIKCILTFNLPTSPSSDYRLAVHYRGSTYYVPTDELTQAILAMLNDLININRSPDELPKTTAVQVVGG